MRTQIDNQEEDSWAAIGIGAMIVFISLILVAAVASAVIIQTAEKLQQNAQSAGDDTSDELSGKLSIMQGFVAPDGSDYILYIRLAAGSDSIASTSVSWQLYCAAGNGYEDSFNGGAATLFDAGDVQLQSVAAFGGVATMTTQFAYKILINANICDAAAVGALANPVAQLYLHVENGGTTFETLSVSNAAAGNPVI